VSGIFLGRWWHWGILAASVAVLWLAGENRMHVIHFNAFVLGLLAVTAVVVAVVVFGARPGEQMTRDPLDSPAEDDPGGEAAGPVE
jgi:hypothetical protein